MDYKAHALEFFKGDNFALEATGIIIEEVDKDYAKCRLDIKEKHLNANNFVMGGAIFTLADFTMAVAANAGHPETVSMNLNINYLSPAKPPVLYAEAKCIKSGRSVAVYEITVSDTDGKNVAIVVGSGFRKQI